MNKLDKQEQQQQMHEYTFTGQNTRKDNTNIAKIPNDSMQFHANKHQNYN